MNSNTASSLPIHVLSTPDQLIDSTEQLRSIHYTTSRMHNSTFIDFYVDSNNISREIKCRGSLPRELNVLLDFINIRLKQGLIVKK
jgi:hypothetical protein